MTAAAVVLLAALAVLVGMSAGPRLGPDAILAAIEMGSAPRVVDVRTTKEYQAGHVPAATHLAYHRIWLSRAELPAGKGDPLVVYCSHGPRAALARLQLWALGYENVALLEGQMSAWKQRGLPSNTGREPVPSR